MQKSTIPLRALNFVMWALGIKAFSLGYYPTLDDTEPDQLEKRLEHTFPFVQADLDYNRMGTFSPQQVERMQNTKLNGWILLTIAFIMGGVPIIGILAGAVSFSDIGVWVFAAIFIVPEVINRAFRQFNTFGNAKTSENILSINGSIRVYKIGSDSMWEPVPVHYIQIGEKTFSVSAPKAKTMAAFNG